MAIPTWVKAAAFATVTISGGFIYFSTRQGKVAIESQVLEIVNEMQSNNWTALKKHFSLPIRILFRPTDLEKSLATVQKSLGQLTGSRVPQIDHERWTTVVKVPLIFEDVDYGMVLRTTPGGKLLGLHFSSLSDLKLGPGWEPPSYADPKVTETPIQLGPGGWKVEGIFCLPSLDGPRADAAHYPCVIFLGGSGPCDRDCTIGNNKPFRDLALGLARLGVASIRFDKMTLAHGKELRGKNITLTDEYVPYADGAIAFAKDQKGVDPAKIFILGHSLGAVAAPTIATLNPCVAGCIIMAGPAEPIYRCLTRQLRYFISLDGPDVPYLQKQLEDAEKRAELADRDDLDLSTPATKLPFGLGPAYWLNYRSFAPIETVQTMKQPALILQGDRDYQVTKEDFEQWKMGTRAKTNIQWHCYEGLNHLFVRGTRPSAPIEYTLPGHMDERVVSDIASWVLEWGFRYLWTR